MTVVHLQMRNPMFLKLKISTQILLLIGMKHQKNGQNTLSQRFDKQLSIEICYPEVMKVQKK
jgi:hypothetical protein